MTGLKLVDICKPKIGVEQIRQSAAFERLSVWPPLGARKCHMAQMAQARLLMRSDAR
jgi:hypothetical protein